MTIPRPPFTRGLVIVSDSITAVYDLLGSYSWPSEINAILYFDNREIMDQGYSGWSALNASANIANFINSAGNAYPYDWLISLGANDFASVDTTTGESVANDNFSIADAFHADPRYANGFIQIVLPDGSVPGGAVFNAWFWARVAGQDQSSNPLPGYVNGTTYSAANIDCFTVVDGSGHRILFRITSSGTATIAVPSWNFTTGSTTALGGGAIATNYGRIYNEIVLDPANEAAHHYTGVNITDPDLISATAYNNPMWWKADKIHLNQNAHIQKMLPNVYGPIFKQTGVSPAPYRATVLGSISPAVGAQGTPATLSLIEAGEAGTIHQVQIGGLDCPSFVRNSDILLSFQVPLGLAPSAIPYDVTYTRSDGLTRTLPGAFTCVQSHITGVKVMTGTVAAPVDVIGGGQPAYCKATTANPLVIQVEFDHGATPVTGLALNGVNLTSVTVLNDTTATGILPAANNTVGVGNVTATGTMTNAPTALANGWEFKLAVDPVTRLGATIVRQVCTPTSIQIGGGFVTGWADTTIHSATNGYPTANGSPPATTSTHFSKNGSGVSVVPIGGGMNLKNTGFVFLLNDTHTNGTPVFVFSVMYCTPDASNGQFWFLDSAVAWDLQITAQSDETPTATAGNTAPLAHWPISLSNKAYSMYGYISGRTTPGTCGIAVSDGINPSTEVRPAAGSAGNIFDSINPQIGGNSGASFVGESALSIILNACPFGGTNIITGADISDIWLFAHDETNCP